MQTKYLIAGAIIIVLPFIFFLMFLQRRTTELQNSVPNILQQRIVTDSQTGDPIEDQRREQAQQEYRNLALLERGTVVGFDETTQIISIISQDPLNPSVEELVEIDTSTVSRFACWNSEEHKVAKNAYFPLQPTSTLSLNNEIILNEYTFGNTIGKYTFFKIDLQSESTPIQATQVAVIDC